MPSARSGKPLPIRPLLRETSPRARSRRVFGGIGAALAAGAAIALLGATRTAPAATLERVEVLDVRHATVLLLHLDAPARGFTQTVERGRLVVELPGVADGTRGAKVVIGGRHADHLRVVRRRSGVALVVHPGSGAEPFRHHGLVSTQAGLVFVVGVDPVDVAPGR